MFFATLLSFLWDGVWVFIVKPDWLHGEVASTDFVWRRVASFHLFTFYMTIAVMALKVTGASRSSSL